MNGLTAKLASTSKVETTQLLIPPDANGQGIAFGGRVLEWMDRAGAIAAMRHARTQVVTAAIDQLSFVAPIRVGEIVVIRAQVNATFGSSMEVEVTVMAEPPERGETRPCCEAFLTFVSIGPDGRPSKAPILLTETEDEERRSREATIRRAERLARRRKG